jgi:hypothetical protein
MGGGGVDALVCENIQFLSSPVPRHETLHATPWKAIENNSPLFTQVTLLCSRQLFFLSLFSTINANTLNKISICNHSFDQKLPIIPVQGNVQFNDF